MGDIYAAAVLTVISAIGDDPTYGLPGVAGTERGEVVEVDGEWEVQVIPPSRDLAQITHSRWATRAWTFQEGLLSNRRLFLTERQAIFVCNTYTQFESDADNGSLTDPFLEVGWLPPRGLALKKTPMETAFTYLVAYSQRKLSYDFDALNAILGALNTLRRDSVYQIWGLPFSITKTRTELQAEREDDMGFPLAWFHWQPAKRRSCFPSWSILGWEGGVAFQYGMGASLPATVPASALILRTSTRRYTLSECRLLSGTGISETPHLLEIFARTWTPRLIGANSMISYSGKKRKVNIYWSISEAELSALSGIKALSIAGGDLLIRSCSPQDRGVSNGISMFARYYERIGFASYHERMRYDTLEYQDEVVILV
jgi:hypothetical protein